MFVLERRRSSTKMSSVWKNFTFYLKDYFFIPMKMLKATNRGWMDRIGQGKGFYR